MKRYLLASIQGTGAENDPFRPNVAGSYVMIGPQVGNRCLVKVSLPDGTAATNATVADLDDSNPDAPAQDVTATALTPTQINAIKTFLTNQGIDITLFDADGVADRRALLHFLLRRWIGWAISDLPLAIKGFEVGS